MNEGKGKGRASSDDEVDKSRLAEQPSIASRVAASASGLARDVFATHDGNELSERATAAIGDKRQIRHSSSANSTWAESSKAQNATHQPSSASAFRVGHNEQHIKQSETEFSSFLDSIDSFTPSQETGESQFASGASADDFEEAWKRSQPTPDHPPQRSKYASVAEQQNRDGEDVIKLLSESSDMEDMFEPSPEDEHYDWGLSTEQLQQLRAMTQDLFPPVQEHGAVEPSHPLNLSPSFDLAVDHSTSGRESWREQWDGVLNRYTDEVWGGLLPLVKEARKEVEGLGNNPTSTEQPKALRRLGAILGHLRKY